MMSMWKLKHYFYTSSGPYYKLLILNMSHWGNLAFEFISNQFLNIAKLQMFTFPITVYILEGFFFR